MKVLVALEVASFGLLAAAAAGFGWLLGGPVAGLSSAGLVAGAAGLYVAREMSIGASEAEVERDA